MRQAVTRAACALVLLGATSVALPAFAQQATPSSQSRATITVPLQELPPADTLGERAERLWSGVTRLFSVAPNREQMVRNAGNAERRHAQARDEFSWLMNIAGFKLKEIESYIGLIPSLSLTFGQARELTEADRDYVEQQLQRHARRNPGPLAAMQRSIVRTVLEASEVGGFSVEKVEIDIFPLPKVKLSLAPADAPVGIDAARILRQIERLQQRLQTPGPRPQDIEMLPPRQEPLLRPVSFTEASH